MQDELARLNWISRCADSACVEVALNRDGVLMRDSKDRNGGVLTFDRAQWTSFQAAIRAGEFDRG